MSSIDKRRKKELKKRWQELPKPKPSSLAGAFALGVMVDMPKHQKISEDLFNKIFLLEKRLAEPQMEWIPRDTHQNAMANQRRKIAELQSQIVAAEGRAEALHFELTKKKLREKK